MKRDFLTIPDAPNYEINSELIVRRKKSRRLLKPYMPKKATKNIFTLRADGKIIKKAADTLRAQALAAIETDKFDLVPSLNNLYEFNLKTNQLRNIKTKLFLKPHKGCFYVTIKDKELSISITSLRWEIGGILPPSTSSIKRSCILSKDNLLLHFESRRAAAKFLANKFFYSESRIRELMIAREEFICDWHVNYLEDEKPGCGDALVGAYYGPGRRGGGCHV